LEVVRRIGGETGWKRNDDLVDDGGIDESVDTPLENRPAGQSGELFRAAGPEPQATTTRCDDC
jgi:hypothetical protein